MEPKNISKRYLKSAIILVCGIYVAIVIFSFGLTKKSNRSAAWIAHTQEVLLHSERLRQAATDVETGSRAFLLTGQQQFNGIYLQSKTKSSAELALLRDLTMDNKSQKPRIDSLQLLIDERAAFADSIVTYKKTISMASALFMVSSGKGIVFMRSVDQLVGEMQTEENRLLEKRKKENANAVLLQEYSFFGIALIMLCLMTAFFWKEKQRIEQGQQKKAEEELRKSEENFRMLVSSVKDYAIFLLDKNGRVVSWNEGAEHIKGYKENEIIGKSFEVFYSEEDVKKGEPFHNLEKAKQYGHYEKEGWRYRKDGSKFWANVIFTALKDAAGHLYGFSKITRDITERKKAEDELGFLARQINLSNDAIYTLGTDFKIKSWNRGAENMYGFTEAEVLGKDSNEILNTSIESERIKTLIAVIAEQDHWSGELTRKTKSGNDIFISSSTTVIRDGHKMITGYVSVNLDITRQKKLREQVNHLATMVEQSTEAIISRGIDQRIISWNKRAEKLFGHGKGEAIGKTFAELRYAKLGPQEIKGIEKQISEGGTWKAEMDFYHKDGSSFFGTVTGNGSKDEQGNVSAFIFIIRDISQRKQLEDDLKKINDDLEIKVKERTEEIYRNEQRFRKLIENSNDMIQLLDGSQKKVYRSPSTERILGWTDEETEKEGFSENMIHPDDLKKALAMFTEARSNPGRPVQAQLRWKHKKGYYLWLEGVVTNFLNDEQINAFVTNFRDVTERVKAEEKIRDLNTELEGKVIKRTEELQKANMEMEAFSYSVSHDLRAPLRAIIGFTNILEEDYSAHLDDEGKRITSIIKGSTSKMGNLIDDLLAFARMGRHDIATTSIDTAAMVDSIINSQDKSRLQIKWLIGDLPNVHADPSALRQVWVNLISNAIKYSSKAPGPAIEIGSLHEKGQTCFYVRDNGIGFDEKYKSKLFKVFQRLHSSEEFDGTGIGLAIVEKIISKHGGRVWAVGIPGKVPPFIFHCPMTMHKAKTIGYEP